MLLPNWSLFTVVIIISMMTIEIRMDDQMTTDQMTTDQMTTAAAQQTDEICESLKKKNGTKLNILVVGRTSERLLLITGDFYVYDVAMDSMDSAIAKLYLRSKPKPLKDKYPGLYGSPYFNSVKDYIFNAWIMKDEEGDWICITTRARNHRDGVSYLINNDEAVKGWIYYDQATEVLISQNQQCRYYSLRHDRHNNLIIGLYQCDQGNSRVRHRPHIGLVTNDFAAICLDETNTKITMQMGACRPGMAVQWPVLKGFVSAGKFYLFGEYYIYIFDESVYLQQGQPFPIEKHSYDSFFNCPGIIPPSSLSKSYFYWIIAAIILLLLILLMILWFILVNRRRRLRIKSSSLAQGKTGRSDLYGRSLSKLNASKMSTNMMVTARSRSMTSRMNLSSLKHTTTHGGSHAAFSGGSVNVTGRTGIEADFNPASPNRLKRLTTRIQSGSRGVGGSTMKM